MWTFLNCSFNQPQTEQWLKTIVSRTWHKILNSLRLCKWTALFQVEKGIYCIPAPLSWFKNSLLSSTDLGFPFSSYINVYRTSYYKSFSSFSCTLENIVGTPIHNTAPGCHSCPVSIHANRNQLSLGEMWRMEWARLIFTAHDHGE